MAAVSDHVSRDSPGMLVDRGGAAKFGVRGVARDTGGCNRPVALANKF